MRADRFRIELVSVLRITSVGVVYTVDGEMQNCQKIDRNPLTVNAKRGHYKEGRVRRMTPALTRHYILNGDCYRRKHYSSVLCVTEGRKNGRTNGRTEGRKKEKYRAIIAL